MPSEGVDPVSFLGVYFISNLLVEVVLSLDCFSVWAYFDQHQVSTLRFHESDDAIICVEVLIVRAREYQSITAQLCRAFNDHLLIAVKDDLLVEGLC